MIEREFTKWLAATDTVILACWDLGHVWDSQIYEHCGVKRARYLTSSWSPDPSRNIYTYPRGYSPRGMMREGFFMDAEHRAAIRREIARRAQEHKRSAPVVPIFKSGER